MATNAMSRKRLTGRVPARSEARDGGRSGLGLASPHAVIGLLCIGLIVVGYVSRGEMDLSPSAGLGYALGIFGLAAMTLLLGYSLRKRIKILRGAGPLRSWFEIHLILGLVGPTAILYHSGFEWGSMNATISLSCMLAVSGSGIGGRFLYGRMHRSLAGARQTVASHFKGASEALRPIASLVEGIPKAASELRAFHVYTATAPRFFILPIRTLATRPHAWRTKRRVMREIRRSGRSEGGPEIVGRALSAYFGHLSRGVELRFFEKLFALWHAIHVPLTVILFISAAIHVVAVHLY